MSYSVQLFQSVGLSMNDSSLATCALGLAQFIATSSTILFVERAGRRQLMLIGTLGMVAALGACTLTFNLSEHSEAARYISIGMTLVFIAFFSIGPSIVPWVVVSELFGQHYRATASSLAICCNWICNFVVMFAFSPMQSAMGHFVLLPFAALCFGFVVFLYKFMPETKGKSFSEILKALES